MQFFFFFLCSLNLPERLFSSCSAVLARSTGDRAGRRGERRRDASVRGWGRHGAVVPRRPQIGAVHGAVERAPRGGGRARNVLRHMRGVPAGFEHQVSCLGMAVTLEKVLVFCGLRMRTLCGTCVQRWCWNSKRLLSFFEVREIGALYCV